MGFEEGIIGHRRELEVLSRALEGNKVPHAWLFIGIGGIGKRRAALSLAMALQCGAQKGRPCRGCNGCTRTREGNHPDMTIIERDGSFIKIEQVRELQKRLGFKPFEGRATVCIIDGADHLNPAAANALLKTLEEPPDATHLILIAENIRQVLPTIVSRCQRLNFSPLQPGEVAEILIREKGISADEAAAAARMSEGSAAKAIALLDSLTKEERQALMETIWGITSVEEVFSVAEKLANKDNMEKLMEILETLKFSLRDAMAFKAGIGEDRLVKISGMELVRRNASRFGMEDLIAMAEKISETERALTMNANKKLTIENMLLAFHGRAAGACP